MKKLGIIFLLASCWAQAQQFNYKPTGVGTDTKVVIRNFFADIDIIGSTGSDIEITAIDYEGMPEKAKGLRPLSASGPENTGIGLNVSQEGNEVVITAASRRADDGEYRINIPKNLKVRIDYGSWQAGDLFIRDLANELEVKTQVGELRIEDVTGPIVAHSLSSDIEVKFSELSQAGPTSISSTSGDLDITVPESTKGQFRMSSTSGEVYTDLDFEFENDKDLRRYGGGMSASATLNGGGVEISLKCVSGDIYVRKQ